MHGKWFPVLSALKPSFRKPHFLPAHLETTMCQLVRILRWSKGLPPWLQFHSAASTKESWALRVRVHDEEKTATMEDFWAWAPEGLSYALSVWGWSDSHRVRSGRRAPKQNLSTLCLAGEDVDERPWLWEGQGSWWEGKFFQLPDVLCIKMGFSKIRKPQRLQSDCRWKYLLIKSICFFWFVGWGSILNSEVGNWWIQENHTFSHLQIPPSTAVCIKEGNSWQTIMTISPTRPKTYPLRDTRPFPEEAQTELFICSFTYLAENYS